ncbi:MAG: diacylglycerol kinase [Microcoleaceae cyanobacterium MO_207.B10]|nr:diacylglycerol kinase [Microcoleaceae cyanobacterium MO_207.B10]
MIYEILIAGKGAKYNLIAGMGEIGLGLILKLLPVQIAVMLIAIGLIVAMELLNTAIESAVDLIVPKTYHDYARIAKDSAAGGVMFSALVAIFILSLLLFPTLFKLVSSG